MVNLARLEFGDEGDQTDDPPGEIAMGDGGAELPACREEGVAGKMCMCGPICGFVDGVRWSVCNDSIGGASEPRLGGGVPGGACKSTEEDEFECRVSKCG